LFTLAVAALRFLLIAWLVDEIAVLVFAQTLHAFTFGAYHASALTLVHRYFRGRNQARGQALYNSLAFGVGGSLGSLYSGVAWEGLGAGWTFSLAAACAALAAMVFAWKGTR
jgi:PPP family 3-phenylpropionic acid transporter